MSSLVFWNQCISYLERDISEQDINTWLRPLQIEYESNVLSLYAPNPIVMDWVEKHAKQKIETAAAILNSDTATKVILEVGSRQTLAKPTAEHTTNGFSGVREPNAHYQMGSRLDPKFTFESFVQGNSNQIALAAARQVAQNPGSAYNPLFVYGGSGLGKTHLSHSIGNAIREYNPNANIIYLNSERFVQDMVKALQHNKIDEFKRFYRSADALMIDDIQFLAGKDRSQEEFFHTFNSLIEGEQQIVLTCDRYPKELNRLEDRLKSRFGWGLTVQITPPELETRVAILINKAELYGWQLNNEVAFFIAQSVRSNVRELEGALKRVIATADFKGSPITLALTKEALRDLLHLQERMVTIDNIQQTVANYFKIKVSDLLSARRNRSIARPRQIAMSLSKELTDHSLPEIGRAFGGRDHTTVLHACRKTKALRDESLKFNEDYDNLIGILTS